MSYYVFPRRTTGIDVIMNALGTVEGQDRGFVDAKLVPGRPIGVGFFKPVWSPPKDGLVAEVRHESGFEFKLSYPNCWVCWIVCLDSHGLYCCTVLLIYRGIRTNKKGIVFKRHMNFSPRICTRNNTRKRPNKTTNPFLPKVVKLVNNGLF